MLKTILKFKKSLIVLGLFILVIGGVIGGYFYPKSEMRFGAPVFQVMRSLIPETHNTYYLGTSSPSTIAWRGIFTTDLTVSGTCTGCSGASVFSFATNYNVLTAATSSALWAQAGIFASSTSHFANFDFVNGTSTLSFASTGSTTLGNTAVGTLAATTLTVPNLTSALIVTDSAGLFAEYGGATSCTNQVFTAFSALGASTCSSINNDFWSGADLSVANGGTGLSTFGGSNTILYTTAADTLSSEAALTYNPSTDVLTSVNLSITNGTSTTLSVSGSTTLQHFIGQNATTTKLSILNWFTTGSGTLHGIASTSPNPLFGLNIATSTSFMGVQLANSIASSTTNAAGVLREINWSTSTTQSLILTGNATLVINSTSSQPRDGGKYTLKLCQDNTGSRTATFITPQSLRWAGATTTIGTAANTCTFIGMIYDAAYSMYYVVGSSTGAFIR